MVSTKEYLDFVLEQLSELDAELELPYEGAKDIFSVNIFLTKCAYNQKNS